MREKLDSRRHLEGIRPRIQAKPLDRASIRKPSLGYDTAHVSVLLAARIREARDIRSEHVLESSLAFHDLPFGLATVDLIEIAVIKRMARYLMALCQPSNLMMRKNRTTPPVDARHIEGPPAPVFRQKLSEPQIEGMAVVP